VIAYASRTLNPAERNNSAELECLALVWGIRRMRDYLEGYRFTVLTDHQSLKWLQQLEAPTGRLGRWLFELQQFDFEIQYRRSQNQVADALSRAPQIGAVRRGTSCHWYGRLIREVRRHPIEYPDYRIEDGRLYRHVLHDLNFRDTPAGQQWKQCVPRDQRAPLLQRLHDEPAPGHLGTAKTWPASPSYTTGPACSGRSLDTSNSAPPAWRTRCPSNPQPGAYTPPTPAHPGNRYRWT